MDFSKNATECPEPLKAEVKGNIPSWLQGTLLRNGPGIFSVGDTSYDHWFDGMSIMHSFSFKDGEVIHRSRFLRSDTYKANMESNRIVVSEMGTMAYPDPSKNFIVKAITFLNHTVPDFTDNGASNFIKYGQDYFATSETNYIRKIDPVTLETQEKVDYMKFVPVNLASSHPHYDKEGNAYNVGTCVAEKGKTKYLLFKVPAVSPKDKDKKDAALKNVEVICSVPCRSLLTPSYYHSFGMTDNYFIFIEQPFKLDILKMATAYMRGVNWASCLKFCPEDNTLIHLIDRKTGKVTETKYYTEAMVVYHHVNAFEVDGYVVFDVIAYKDSGLYDMFYLSKLKEKPGSHDSSYSKPSYKRFALPVQPSKGAPIGENLVKGTCTTATAVKEKEGKLVCQAEVLYEGIELPRINYDLNSKRHRFVYCNCVEESALSKEIAKFDTETKQVLTWSEINCWPSEAVFVPRPNGEAEDDGVILSSVINTSPDQSNFLLVLDGRTFKELARGYLNTELHKDMHGFFIPHGN
ncbi:beta,beta-carotene 15,15'-dioxygenase [Syngnathoides biaculeatus]|uniref:beta,beta-carotene 15,15'-dioxygenase n=1 Tax=Syngnathoides biaculeatus TaxID=300417 RepID=UPI002ADE08EA|nr:beta,beta-carotene 15,15'-dioxygenase [Syngnathoides biaculeatus]XP_061661280.1 beta,beta-carotene 15,15'-dioxygenase [Syngnathoides biaculeatus]XP_061661281.1 beta,beta-carotene 15,15'-dioxygenase [Syngnathoides biaculeatus]